MILALVWASYVIILIQQNNLYFQLIFLQRYLAQINFRKYIHCFSITLIFLYTQMLKDITIFTFKIIIFLENFLYESIKKIYLVILSCFHEKELPRRVPRFTVYLVQIYSCVVNSLNIFWRQWFSRLPNFFER